VTSISDLQQGNLSLRLRRLSAWALRRGRPVLPQYEAERSTWWATLRRLLLLAAIGFVSVFYGLLVSVLPPVLLMPFSVPLVVLGLLVIWALPELPRAPLRALSASFLIFFVLMLLWPNYLAFSFAGLPWISVRRLVGGIASALLLINISVSVDMRTKMRAMLKESKLISTFLIGFAAVQFVSVIFSDGLSGTIARYIDYQIIWIAMFFIAVWFFGEQKNIDRWFRYIITVTIILIIIGALEFSQKHVLWVGYIPSFLQVNDDAVQQILTPGYRGLYRVVTTFSTPLSWGEYIAVASAFVLHGLMQAKTVKSRLIWGAFDIIALLSAFLSGARLAMVGFIVAHAVYFFIWGARTWRLKPGGLIGPAVTLMYPAIMVAAGYIDHVGQWLTLSRVRRRAVAVEQRCPARAVPDGDAGARPAALVRIRPGSGRPGDRMAQHGGRDLGGQRLSDDRGRLRPARLQFLLRHDRRRHAPHRLGGGAQHQHERGVRHGAVHVVRGAAHDAHRAQPGRQQPARLHAARPGGRVPVSPAPGQQGRGRAGRRLISDAPDDCRRAAPAGREEVA
jgi:hypothetical protein